MTADQHPHAGPSGIPDTTGIMGTIGTEAADPVEETQAVRSSVRGTARGMAHHEAEEALEKARSEDDGRKDGAPSPAVEEWERIVDLLNTHAGPYDPDADPFVQGELTAHANRQAAKRTESTGADAADADAADARDTLLRALARAGVRDGAGGENESVVDRIVRADAAAALAVGRWLDAAFAAGRARTED